MTKPAKTQTASARVVPLRRPASLDLANRLCPNEEQAFNIARSFGLDPVAAEDIRSTTEASLVESANALRDTLNDKAMQIHLQRIVGAFVGSAFGAGEFYSRAVTEAREVTARLSNDARDEDRDGPLGFDSHAQRKREFAATVGLQAFALLCAAQGAAKAYLAITGEAWKPYERQGEAGEGGLSQAAAAAQLAAFN